MLNENFLELVKKANLRIDSFIRRTPILPKPELSHKDWPYLKLENLQLTGSFKIRGIFNNLLSLDEVSLQKGIVVGSGGNHGLSAAYACWKLGVQCKVFLPANASNDRIERIKYWNAEVVPLGETPTEVIKAAKEYAANEDRCFIHPFESETTIAGAGTIALEIYEQVPNVDLCIVAIGGGGLISGTAAVLKTLNPDCKIIGVEPTGASSMLSAIRAGKVVDVENIKTIADTLSPRSVSERTLNYVQKYVDEIILVDDNSMIESMKELWQETNQLVEPAGAAVLSALSKIDISMYKAPVAIICGGNAAAGPTFDWYANR